MKYRIEKDIMGSVKVPSNSYYGIQTVRASENFNISGERIHPSLLKAIVHVKMAAAQANSDLGLLSKKNSASIVGSCKQILSGKYDDQFIVDVYQAGAGTPWHMNVNEVIANVSLVKMGKRKGQYEFLDPHDHVNIGQSTNDVIPTSTRIASLILIDNLLDVCKLLVVEFKKKSLEFRKLYKTGRTHLQDALPISLGQEFGAYADVIDKHMKVIKNSSENLRYLNIGGTAIGTGLNAHKNLSKYIIKYLKRNTGLKLFSSKNKIAGTQFMGDFLDLSGSLRTLAVEVNKICNDLRLMNSGPMTGFNELYLPKVEPGSSIMPSKFNPSMVEMMNMVCYQVMGNDEVVKEGASAGQFELNVMTPIIAHNLINSIDILYNGLREFTNRCVSGIKANKEVLKKNFEMNAEVGTVLNVIIGYDKTAELIKESLLVGISVKDLALQKGLINKKEADKLFSLSNILKK